MFGWEWCFGWIYGPLAVPTLRWFWSLTINGPMTRSDRVATLEEAVSEELGRVEGVGEAGRGRGSLV